jgi:hypothetical protein
MRCGVSLTSNIHGGYMQDNDKQTQKSGNPNAPSAAGDEADISATTENTGRTSGGLSQSDDESRSGMEDETTGTDQDTDEQSTDDDQSGVGGNSPEGTTGGMESESSKQTGSSASASKGGDTVSVNGFGTSVDTQSSQDRHSS